MGWAYGSETPAGAETRSRRPRVMSYKRRLWNGNVPGLTIWLFLFERRGLLFDVEYLCMVHKSVSFTNKPIIQPRLCDTLPGPHSIENTAMLPIYFRYHMNSARWKSGQDSRYRKAMDGGYKPEIAPFDGLRLVTLIISALSKARLTINSRIMHFSVKHILYNIWKFWLKRQGRFLTPPFSDHVA